MSLKDYFDGHNAGSFGTYHGSDAEGFHHFQMGKMNTKPNNAPNEAPIVSGGTAGSAKGVIYLGIAITIFSWGAVIINNVSETVKPYTDKILRNSFERSAFNLGKLSENQLSSLLIEQSEADVNSQATSSMSPSTDIDHLFFQQFSEGYGSVSTSISMNATTGQIVSGALCDKIISIEWKSSGNKYTTRDLSGSRTFKLICK